MRNEQLVAKVGNYAHVLRDQKNAFVDRFVPQDPADDPVSALLTRIREECQTACHLIRKKHAQSDVASEDH